MSKDDLHEVAQLDTPAAVHVPANWCGLLVWAVGKWGAGAIFLALLVPVYLDLKTSNERFAEIASSTARAVDALAVKIEASNQAIVRLDDAIRRLETTPKNHQQ
jgi:hypothetical protein